MLPTRHQQHDIMLCLQFHVDHPGGADGAAQLHRRQDTPNAGPHRHAKRPKWSTRVHYVRRKSATVRSDRVKSDYHWQWKFI